MVISRERNMKAGRHGHEKIFTEYFVCFRFYTICLFIYFKETKGWCREPRSAVETPNSKLGARTPKSNPNAATS